MRHYFGTAQLHWPTRALVLRIAVITASLPNVDIPRWEARFLTNCSKEWGGTLMMGAGTLSHHIMSCSKNFMCPWKCSYGSREARDQASLREPWWETPASILFHHTLISGPMWGMHFLVFANKKLWISFDPLRFSEDSTGSLFSFRKLLQIWVG